MRRFLRPSLLASLFLLSTVAVSPPAAAGCIDDGGHVSLTACAFEPGDEGSSCDTIVAAQWNILEPPVSPSLFIVGASLEQCDGGSTCYGANVWDQQGQESLFNIGECDGNIPPICEDGACEVPTLCDPGLPCLSLTPGDVAQPVTTTANGDPLVTVGGATVTFTTGHFTTAVLAAEGDNAPCSTVIGLPGVADCVANSILSDRTFFEPTASGVNPLACLKDAWLGVDVNGDGTEETGGPAFVVEAGSTNCST